MRIVITVESGAVTQVRTDQPADWIVLDYDTEGASEGDTVEIDGEPVWASGLEPAETEIAADEVDTLFALAVSA